MIGYRDLFIRIRVAGARLLEPGAGGGFQSNYGDSGINTWFLGYASGKAQLDVLSRVALYSS